MSLQNAYRYATRDEAGMYLGAHTLDEAKAIWPEASRRGLIIYVPDKVSTEGLEDLLNGRRSAPDAATSVRLRHSARKAIEGSLSALRKGRDPHRDPSSPPLMDVFNKGEKPVCTVPLDVVEAVFGSGWFLVDDSTVQLVTTFNGSKLKWLANDARKRYEESLPAPRARTSTTPSATDDDALASARMVGTSYLQLSAPEEESTAGSTTGDADDGTHGPTPQSPRRAASEPHEPVDRLYVTRDAMGLYLGAHKLGWARSRQDDARVDEGVIVLPEALPTRKAASLAGKAGKKTLQLFNRDFQKAIKRSESFMSNIPRLTSEAFWSRQDLRLVEVRSLTSSNLGSLTPPQLRELFGNGWFLVSPAEAQLTVPVDDEIIGRIQKLEAETRAANDAQRAGKRRAWEATSQPQADEEAVGEMPDDSTGRAQITAHQDTIPTFVQLMVDLGISERHARTIYDQVMLIVRHGYRSKLTETLRKAFPTDPVALPGGRALDVYRIAGALARKNGQRLTDAERDFVLIEVDKAMTRGEEHAEEERRARDMGLEEARRHKHAVSKWTETVSLDPDASSPSRELAEVFERRQGVVLVMQDGDMYRSVLNTDIDDASFASVVPFLPFAHFIVRVPQIRGVYGFGVVQSPRGSGVDLLAIPDGSQAVEDSDALLPFFRKVLFFICSNRDFASGGREYFDQAGPDSARSAATGARANGDGLRRQRGAMGTVVRGRSFDIGMRVIFLTEGPGFRRASTSGIDIRPHAVAGTTYVNSNGTEVVRRPYWNHGAGNKRNALPPEIVERNIRYRDGA
ncbi:MAG: hypothetical protein IKG22_00910 [Atopobiaceae bacterium]|nr:hypothetical protein [Atopobiaceae bacterium]